MESPDTPQTITAQGSAPTDQIVTVSKWHVNVGDTVTTGQLLADMEADKAVFEFSSPTLGTIHALLAQPGDELNIGDPLLQIAPSGLVASATSESAQPNDPLSKPIVRRPSREDHGNPVITPQIQNPQSKIQNPPKGVAPVRVGGRAVRCYLTPIHYAEGNDRLTNADLVRRFPHATPDDIVRRTGIVSRPYCDSEQSALSLAIDAATKALTAENLTLDDLTGIVCHTTTPPVNTPSMACMLLNALDPTGNAELMVYDVNAACSGWLYALDAAHNTIQHNPDSAVLVVTTECLSRVVNPEDFDTAILFGDAATATIMRGVVEPPEPAPGVRPGVRASARMESASNPNPGSMYLSQPVLSGKADPKRALTVGFEGRGHITMEGKRVFTEAVRAMTKMTQAAFDRSGIPLDDLDWLVPHQANERIFEAVRNRLDIPVPKVINLIAQHGNTSSSSIPLALAKSAHLLKPNQTVGLCAFGGGFTFGAAILEMV